MTREEMNAVVVNDPVCGRSITADSPHCCVRGGALFFFCGESCRARFLSEPLRFVDIRVAEHAESTASPVACRTVSQPLPVRTSGISNVQRSGQEWERWLQKGGVRGLIGARFLAWRERRHAAQASREMLQQYRAICADFAGLDDRERYRRMVMARMGCSQSVADAVLEAAEESFAAWPVRRALTLCDVVHYLSVAEFLEAHKGEHWMHSDIKRVVSSLIPESLCVERTVGKDVQAAPECDLSW